MLKEILSKLKEINQEEITLRKYIRQLSVLARLRNLTQETQKQIQEMGLTYNITEDFLYQEGLAKGEEKGIEEGRKDRERSMIIKMLKDKTLSIEKIAEIADVHVDYVKQVVKEIKK